jgi:prepilin-type N-terminal cleavage/methylation domain-containing protein
MVCTNTSIRRRGPAFTLVELLITLGIGGMLLAAVALISENFMRSVAFLTNSVELDAMSRIAFDRLSREIRQCDAVQSCTANSLVLRLGTNLVSFEYKPETRHLLRSTETNAQLYLGGCDYVRFDLFQRNLMKDSYDNYPAATPDSCKVVQLSWICSRDLLGKKVSTATMQSAKVVIRKQHAH